MVVLQPSIMDNHISFKYPKHLLWESLAKQDTSSWEFDASHMSIKWFKKINMKAIEKQYKW